MHTSSKVSTSPVKRSPPGWYEQYRNIWHLKILPLTLQLSFRKGRFHKSRRLFAPHQPETIFNLRVFDFPFPPAQPPHSWHCIEPRPAPLQASSFHSLGCWDRPRPGDRTQTSRTPFNPQVRAPCERSTGPRIQYNGAPLRTLVPSYHRRLPLSSQSKAKNQLS